MSAAALAKLNQARLAAKEIMFATKNAEKLKDIYGRGTGIKDVQNARKALDASSMARIRSGMTKAEVEAARDFYNAAAKLGKGGDVAVERAKCMEDILGQWK